MDEYKAENELKRKPSIPYTDFPRQFPISENEPSINFEKIKLNSDDLLFLRTGSFDRGKKKDCKSEANVLNKIRLEHFGRKRKKSMECRRIFYQKNMRGLGVFILLLFLIIGCALKFLPSTSGMKTASSKKCFSLSGKDFVDYLNDTQLTVGVGAKEEATTSLSTSFDSTPPLINRPVPKQGKRLIRSEDEQGTALQSALDDIPTQFKKQEQTKNTVSNFKGSSALPSPLAFTEGDNKDPSVTSLELKRTMIEMKHQTRAEETGNPAPMSKFISPGKDCRMGSLSLKATPYNDTELKIMEPSRKLSPVVGQNLGQFISNADLLKSVSPNNYTLQLSGSSNYINLKNWANKSNIKNYVVYQTSRNGKPWYVVVSGVYKSKGEAKLAVSTLPANVKEKKPWVKPMYQVQADLH